MSHKLVGLLRLAFVGTWLLLLALVTLTPGLPDPRAAERIGSICLVCGDKGLSEAFLNLVMFAPLGFALGGNGRWLRRALATGFALSAAIELTQLFIPGRYSTVGDVVWNTMGAACGAMLAGVLLNRLAPPASTPRRGLVAALCGAGVLLIAAWLLKPSPTRDRYWGQWTPDLGHLAQYRGRVLGAELNGLPVPSGEFPSDRDPRGDLLGDWSLVVLVVKGPEPPTVSPIVSIYDEQQREILLLGAHREHVVLRTRARAKRVGLDQPDLRFQSGFAGVPVGDTMRLEARRQGSDFCLSVDEVERCGLGVTPGRTWGFLRYLEGPPERLRLALDALWMAALFFLAGFLSPTLRSTAINGGVAALAVAAIVVLTGLINGPWSEAAGAFAGLISGFASATLVRRAWGALVSPAPPASPRG